MSKLQTAEFTAPSYWASYLINGDASGMSDDEIQSCDAWLAAMNLTTASCVDAVDAGFCHIHDATNGKFSLAADCQTYTFIL